MSMTKELSINILKWTGVLPLVVIAYFATKAIFDFTSVRYIPDLIHDISTNGGFGGHYILGPLYIFQREMVATLAAVLSGVYIAPSHKKIVYFTFIGLFATAYLVSVFFVWLSLEAYPWTTELVILTAIEAIAQMIGLGACGYYVWESKNT